MADKKRFEIELEFVQMLANPKYLHFLAQEGIFADEDFVRYLDYLQYWKQSPYVGFLAYPQCLKFLDLLQDESYRTLLASPQFQEALHHQQFYHWQYHLKNLSKESTTKNES